MKKIILISMKLLVEISSRCFKGRLDLITERWRMNIWNISPVYALNGQVNIHAGNAFSGFTEGPNGVGRLDLPWGFAKSTNGNIYVANDHFVTEVNSLKTIKIFAIKTLRGASHISTSNWGKIGVFNIIFSGAVSVAKWSFVALMKVVPC